MMIGPEPMSMMRWRSARRGTNQLFDDRVEVEAGRPSGRAAQLGRVAYEHRHIGGAHKRRIRLQYRIGADESKHTSADGADLHSGSARNVVDLSGRAALHEIGVRASHILHMEKVSYRRHVA